MSPPNWEPSTTTTYLAVASLAGQQYAHGLSNNDYQYRPWHLAEALHPTNWASQQMARVIKRRDPTSACVLVSVVSAATSAIVLATGISLTGPGL